MKKTWPKALFLGIASSLCFSVTYILNSSMAQSGGNWMWSASLRYLFMLPFLLVLNAKNLKPVFAAIGSAPGKWILWSTVGFGLFYAPMAFASAYGPSWLVAGSFQFTYLAGALITPLFRDESGKRQKIPVQLFPAFAVIIAGVFLLQFDQMKDAGLNTTLLFAIPVLLCAFSYPLGNRKVMELAAGKLTTLQRVLAMTVCSLPFWLIMAITATCRVGLPSASQAGQALAVAVISGVIATTVFFKATDMVRMHPQRLALVESTQCGDLIFSLLGGILLLGDPLPGLPGWFGLALIVGGMIVNSLLSTKNNKS